ncbi:MAG: UDP-N-acetylglucosamine 2-epimerase (non-hydrolyzing) [Planctomycetaceae bacterium]
MSSLVKTIVTVVGARPQFIKAAILSHAVAQTEGLREILVHTGQHYDAAMSDVFFQQLGIPEPKYHLGIGSGSHGAQTGRMLESIETVLQQENPDWLLVYGDTNSTLAGALAAVKLHIPVAHVEAGLRSFNRRMPEEINRILTDHASTALFPPTQTARKNLLREGFEPERIHMVGDVMYDAALYFAQQADRGSTILSERGLTAKAYALATIHRAENTDDPSRLTAIFDGLQRFAETMPVVVPLHPRTVNTLKKLNVFDTLTRGLTILEPVGYLDMVALEKNARLIATDSGGVQKEAYFYRVPCITLRDETEWTELVDSGWNRLCPPVDGKNVLAVLTRSIDAAGQERDLYGGGDACRLILKSLLETDLDRSGELNYQAHPLTRPLQPRSLAG